MSNDDTTKPDIRLAVTITDTGYAYDRTSYRHFAARAYILAADKYGEHRTELHSPASYSVDAGKARVLDGLEFTAQADSDSMKRPGSEWYAWEVRYDRHRIQLRDAEEILPVLRKIAKRIDRLTAELGRPATIAQFCAYAASAITAERSVFMRSVPASQDWEGHGYRSMDANALDYHLQSDAQEWRKDHGIDVSAS